MSRYLKNICSNTVLRSLCVVRVSTARKTVSFRDGYCLRALLQGDVNIPWASAKATGSHEQQLDVLGTAGSTYTLAVLDRLIATVGSLGSLVIEATSPKPIMISTGRRPMRMLTLPSSLSFGSSMTRKQLTSSV